MKIVQLDCDNTTEAYPMCVSTVHYIVTKTQGEHTAESYGAVSITLDESTEYTAFNELTEDQVKGWIQIDTSAVEAQLDAQLAEMISPSIISVISPFAVAEPIEEPVA